MKLNTKAKAAAEEAVATGLQVALINLDLIADHPDIKKAYRALDTEHVELLANDIAANGLDAPIVVWGTDEVGGVMIKDKKERPATFLIDGLHRRAALNKLRKDNPKAFEAHFENGEIPCFVRVMPIQDALCLSLRANVQHKAATAASILPVIELLMEEHGMQKKDIAKRIGRSPSWVTQIMSVKDELGEEATEEIKKGKVKMSELLSAAKASKAAKASGKPIAAKEAIAKASENRGEAKRAPRRTSPARVYEAYKSLPTLGIAKKLEIAEAALAYLADKIKRLPKELDTEETKPSRGKVKIGKK